MADVLHAAYLILLECGNRNLACFRDTKLFLDLGIPIGSSGFSYGFFRNIMYHSQFIEVLRASPKLLVSSWLREIYLRRLQGLLFDPSSLPSLIKASDSAR